MQTAPREAERYIPHIQVNGIAASILYGSAIDERDNVQFSSQKEQGAVFPADEGSGEIEFLAATPPSIRDLIASKSLSAYSAISLLTRHANCAPVSSPLNERRAICCPVGASKPHLTGMVGPTSS
jgi:hypothetical protein